MSSGVHPASRGLAWRVPEGPCEACCVCGADLTFRACTTNSEGQPRALCRPCAERAAAAFIHLDNELISKGA